jgi:RNA polymerase sigma-70 factor (ECF subfamily)
MATIQLAIDDEAGLVARAAAGESAAFAELYDRYSRYIYRVALRVTGKCEDAGDVRQQTFLKAFQHMRHFRYGARFSTWLTQIARNESISILRKRRSGRQVSLDDPAGSAGALEFNRLAARPETADPEEKHRQSELRARLGAILGKLEPAFRRAFLLRNLEERSTRQTAAELGVSEPAVKSRLYRARLRLRALARAEFARRPGRRALRAAEPAALAGFGGGREYELDAAAD